MCEAVETNILVHPYTPACERAQCRFRQAPTNVVMLSFGQILESGGGATSGPAVGDYDHSLHVVIDAPPFAIDEDGDGEAYILLDGKYLGAKVGVCYRAIYRFQSPKCQEIGKCFTSCLSRANWASPL